MDRVALDRVDQRRGRLVAVDRYVDQGIGARLAVQLGELLGVDRDRLRGHAVAVDHGGQAARAPQARDVLAEDEPLGGSQLRSSRGHLGRILRGLITERSTKVRQPNSEVGVACRGMAATILIVEDEFAVARGIQYALQQEGYQVDRRALAARRAWTSRRTRPRTSSSSTSACRGSTASRSSAACGRRGSKAPGPDPHRARRRGRQGDRPGARRRRLRDQALRAARADEPDQGPPAAGLRRPGRRGRRPGDPPRRPADRPRAAARPARRAPDRA